MYFFPALLRYSWQKLHTIRLYNVIFKRGSTWFNIHILHCEMITIIKLINTSIISHGYHLCVCVCVCVCVVTTLKIYSLNKFQVHNTILLTIITMLYTRSPESSLIASCSVLPAYEGQLSGVWEILFQTSRMETEGYPEIQRNRRIQDDEILIIIYN